MMTSQGQQTRKQTVFNLIDTDDTVVDAMSLLLADRIVISMLGGRVRGRFAVCGALQASVHQPDRHDTRCPSAQVAPENGPATDSYSYTVDRSLLHLFALQLPNKHVCSLIVPHRAFFSLRQGSKSLSPMTSSLRILA